MVSNGRGSYGSPVYFMGVDQARFRRPVRPGDQLRIEVKLLRMRLSVLKYACAARVDGELAAEAELTAKLMPPVVSTP
jgi:3-hydroxyacyl-[acyl-carrier-protein] dehydratase